MSYTDLPERAQWRGTPALVWKHGDSRVTVLPHRGGKIASYIAGGREWLTQPPNGALPKRDSGNFIESEMWGWDECAPTVEACEIRGRVIPGHGELWRQTWGWEANALEAIGHALPFRFRRSLHLISATQLRLDYRVESTAPIAIPFLWAAHPQFSAPPGSVVDLGPGSLVEVQGETAVGSRSALIGIDEFAPGHSSKHYLDPRYSIGSATLSVPGAPTLKMRWDSHVAPYCGLWFDRHKFTDHDVVAIEPATGWYDSVERAEANGWGTTIPAGGEISWWVELSVG